VTCGNVVDLSSAYSKRSDLAESLVRAVSQLRNTRHDAEAPRVSAPHPTAAIPGLVAG